MTQDEQHLDLLAIFHYVVGGLLALFPCIFLIHVSIGVAMLLGAFDGATQPPPKAVGWLFVIIPSLVILAVWMFAGFIIAAGRKLKRRKAHTFCMVVAGVECMLMPFGTVLGVFTLVVLTKDPVRALFATRASDPPTTENPCPQ